jgi:hypothetical protein
MGDIVFWALVRMAIVIPAIWALAGYFNSQFWWLIGFFAIYGIVFHPAIIKYRQFEVENKEVIELSLCSSCKHFDRSAVLCMKYDQHPSKDYLPCEGTAWEPFENEYQKKEEC